MARRYLVTGGAGFIGSNFIRHLLGAEPDAIVTNLDLLTYAGVAATVAELDADGRHRFVHGDVRDADLLERLAPEADVIVNFAAETHVDRSITGPVPFLETNVVGTGVVLEAARRHAVPRFIHVSTDEVYGSVPEGLATEASPLRPSSPYSASKAAADLLITSYAVTHGYGVIVTRCSNNFGPYQFPEKVIPLFVTNLLDGRTLPLYGDGLHERDWLHVSDHAAALYLLVDEGEPGVYNIAAGNHLTNRDLAERLVVALGADPSMIESVPDRPGHDRRYEMASSRIRALGWEPRRSVGDGLEDTIAWYRDRRDWWEPLRREPT